MAEIPVLVHGTRTERNGRPRRERGAPICRARARTRGAPCRAGRRPRATTGRLGRPFARAALGSGKRPAVNCVGERTGGGSERAPAVKHTTLTLGERQ